MPTYRVPVTVILKGAVEVEDENETHACEQVRRSVREKIDEEVVVGSAVEVSDE